MFYQYLLISPPSGPYSKADLILDQARLIQRLKCLAHGFNGDAAVKRMG